MSQFLITIPMIAFAAWFWWKVGVWTHRHWRESIQKAKHAKTRFHKVKEAVINNMRD